MRVALLDVAGVVVQHVDAVDYDWRPPTFIPWFFTTHIDSEGQERGTWRLFDRVGETPAYQERQR